jgi:hypothetical protein
LQKREIGDHWITGMTFRSRILVHLRLKTDRPCIEWL